MKAEKLTKREQIAKDLMCAMLTGNVPSLHDLVFIFSPLAVKGADALLNDLKESSEALDTVLNH